MIFSTRRRMRSGPVVRGTSALSRALAQIWRRSLQLRVVVLTLGLSAVVILVLGFVLTSQITNRVLDVKVRAATEEVDRARGTVSGIVSGEEARSLDSSLQLARNTLISKPGQASGSGLAGAFDAVLMVPGDGPREATCGRSGRPDSAHVCAISSRPDRSATSTRRAHRRLLRSALLVRHPRAVARQQPRAVPDLPADQRGEHHHPGPGHHGHRWPRAVAPAGRHRTAGVAPGRAAGAIGLEDRRAVRRRAPVRADAGPRRRRYGPAGGVVQRHGREPAAPDHHSRRSSAICSAGSPPTSATNCAPP